MQWRTFGLLLLVLSLGIGVFAVSHVKAYVQVQQFAKNADTGKDVEDDVLNVPPWNASQRNPPQGWVGFNVSLNPEGRMNYRAYGVVLPDDNDKTPDLVMRAVNMSALLTLELDTFDPTDWDTLKVYAAAILNSSRLFDQFTFAGLDNSDKYAILLRGLKNETQDRPVLISIRESWDEQTLLLNPSASNALIIVAAATAVVGSALAIKNPRSQRRVRRPRTRGSHARFLPSALSKNVTLNTFCPGKPNKPCQSSVEFFSVRFLFRLALIWLNFTKTNRAS
jgi:hypothetical protein